MRLPAHAQFHEHLLRFFAVEIAASDPGNVWYLASVLCFLKASPCIRFTVRDDLQTRGSVSSGAILDQWCEYGWTDGIQIDHMTDTEKLEVKTQNSRYEITIIDGPSGEILVRGGPFFPELTPAQLTGATLGGSFCKLRGIYAGFRMELNANGQRTVTSPVQSVGMLV